MMQIAHNNRAVSAMIVTLLSALLLAWLGFAGPSDEPPEEADVASEDHVTVSINVEDTDITDVLTAFSLQTGRSMVIGPEVEGNVTLRLQDTPWQNALEVILKPYGFGYELIGEAVVINRLDRMQEAAVIEPVQSRVYRLEYLDAGDVKEMVEAQLSPRGKMSIMTIRGQKGWEFESSSGGRQGARQSLSKRRREEGKPELIKSKVFIVSDIGNVLDKVSETIAEIDKQPAQILIEARFIEVNTDLLRDLGVDFGTGAQGVEVPGVDPILRAGSADTYGIGAQSLSSQIEPSAFEPNSSGASAALPFNTGLSLMFQQLSGNQFQVLLHAMEEDDRANLLSAPRIRTLDNQEATIIVGTKFPIISQDVSGDSAIATTTLEYYENIGIQLNVVPQICAGKKVNMIVHPAVTARIGTASGRTGTAGNIPLTEYPVLSTREAETQILLDSGETIVIGGMIEEQTRKTVWRVPILGHIPLLGWLFTRETTNTEKLDLLIFLTATIIDEKDAESEDVNEAETVILQEKERLADHEAAVQAAAEAEKARMDRHNAEIGISEDVIEIAVESREDPDGETR